MTPDAELRVLPAAEDPSMTLQQVAERLGLHYMTVYRYVRTGRLPARWSGARWLVDLADVDLLVRAAGPPGVQAGAGAPRPGRPDRQVVAARLERRLLAGDEPGAWAVVQAVMASGAGPADVLLDVLAPAMASVGDRWAAGSATVADEHRATQVATRLVGRLGPAFVRPGRRRGTVVVGSPPGERHALPVALAADLLRAAGFEVVDLGVDVPAPMFGHVVASLAPGGPGAVAVGVTTSDAEPAVAQVVSAVRAADPAVPIAVGGAGIHPAVAAELGADLVSGADARSLVDQLDDLLGGAAPAG